MSSALTRGILVTVRSQYIPEKSSASARQFAFAYTVNIANRGTVTAQLESRH
jgi:ApaG protein